MYYFLCLQLPVNLLQRVAWEMVIDLPQIVSFRDGQSDAEDHGEQER
jgi:hypothetical protein